MPMYARAIDRRVRRYRKGGDNCQPMEAHRRAVLHTAVSNSGSLFDLFNTPGNAVAHFYVRKSGAVEQYINTRWRSSANLDGNPDCITIETWDGYGDSWNGGGNGPKWNRKQRKAIARLLVWLHREHRIPLRRLKSSRPGTRGIGWHRQGIDGNFPRKGILRGRVRGGERWSTSTGKACPTNTRIRQVPGIIRLARVYAFGQRLQGFVRRDRATASYDDED